MKKVYFVYRDEKAFYRQSDGVEFCIIPELQDGSIYFYCQEYSIFWRSISDVGDFEKCCGINFEKNIRPATLNEISESGLISYIDIVKEYDIENFTINKITYINIK